MIGPMETAQLLIRCQAGEPAAIEDFIWTYQHRVFRLALSILDDPVEAEDATQDVFIAAVGGLDSFRGDAAVHTWLYAITVNVCLKRKRTRSRWNRLAVRLREVFSSPSRQTVKSVEQTVIQNEAGAAMFQAVQSLGEKHRLPVILRFYHDLPVSEIARILKIKEGTVHSRLNTARRRLKAALKDEVY